MKIYADMYLFHFLREYDKCKENRFTAGFRLIIHTHLQIFKHVSWIWYQSRTIFYIVYIYIYIYFFSF